MSRLLTLEEWRNEHQGCIPPRSVVNMPIGSVVYSVGIALDVSPVSPVVSLSTYSTTPYDANESKPDDTQLPWAAWNAKVAAFLTECAAQQTKEGP